MGKHLQQMKAYTSTTQGQKLITLGTVVLSL